MTHVTELGYEVVETIDGLDVYENKRDNFVCSLDNRTLADFTYNGEINDDKLEEAIKEKIDLEEFLEENKF